MKFGRLLLLLSALALFVHTDTYAKKEKKAKKNKRPKLRDVMRSE